jgi:hypothetical protein
MDVQGQLTLTVCSVQRRYISTPQRSVIINAQTVKHERKPSSARNAQLLVSTIVPQINSVIDAPIDVGYVTRTAVLSAKLSISYTQKV